MANKLADQRVDWMAGRMAEMLAVGLVASSVVTTVGLLGDRMVDLSAAWKAATMVGLLAESMVGLLAASLVETMAVTMAALSAEMMVASSVGWTAGPSVASSVGSMVGR